MKLKKLLVFAKGFSFLVMVMLFISFFSSVRAIEYELRYDANGNLAQDKEYLYEYDGYNNLLKIKNSKGVIEEYFYDDSGQRIKKIHYLKNETTYYVNDNFVTIVNSSGTYNIKYFYADGQLVARQEAGKTYYYHPDSLGSTNIVTDEYGNVVEKTEYEPFGKVLTGGSDRYGFTGQELDKTGLMYYNARYYSPSLMKFTQPDTIIQDVYDPQSLNRYAYARNNPIKYTDPSGHFAFLAVLAVIAVVAVVSAVVDFGVQMYNNNWDAGKVDYGQVGLAAGIGAVAGAVGAAVGVVGGAIGAGLGLSGAASTVAEGITAVTASIFGGQSARATTNAIKDRPLNEGLFNPKDMAIDGTIGLATWGAVKGYENTYSSNNWYKSNFETSQKSVDYHYQTHVLNRNLPMSKYQYVDNAKSFYSNTLKGNNAGQVSIKPNIGLKDNTFGVKITGTNGEMGIYSSAGVPVSYHPARPWWEIW